MPGKNNLPNDALTNVTSFLDAKDIAHLATVEAKNPPTSVQNTVYGKLGGTTVTFHQASAIMREENELKAIFPNNESMYVSGGRRNPNYKPGSTHYRVAAATPTLPELKRMRRANDRLPPIMVATIGLASGFLVGKVSNNVSHHLIGGNTAGNLVGATVCTATARIAGKYVGGLLGAASLSPYGALGLLGGYQLGSTAGLLGAQVSSIYYGIKHLANDSGTTSPTVTAAGVTAAATGLILFGLYKNKLSIDAKKQRLQQAKQDLKNLKRFK